MADKTDKPSVVHSHDVSFDKEYVQWMYDVKQRFKNAQIKAAVKVNSEQLLFNWQLGRDLVEKRAEEKWGKGVVEQISLDLQAAFPDTKGFSARNLWFMKQWYSFYALNCESAGLIKNLENVIDVGTKKLNQLGSEIREKKLNQLGSEIREKKLNQLGSEMPFPTIFSYVPWKHHVLIVQKCKTIEEALFYIKRTVELGLSRNALDNSIRADMYHTERHLLLNENGELSEPGWSRHLVQVYDRNMIKAPKWRIKEWDYYLVMGQYLTSAMRYLG